MKPRVVILALSFCLSAQTIFAQTLLKAVVKDSSTNESLVGATIQEIGTSNGAVTNTNGEATLPVSGKGDVKFRVQSVGYTAKTVIITIPQREPVITILLSAEGEELEQITISTTRTNSRIENTPTRVEVLGLEEMSEENGIKPGNIVSLLGDIGGIQMQQVSASSGNTYARVQGLDGRYTQILKDGIPLFGGLSGTFSLMQIPPLDLKQIEIIKGSASTLYGGDAIGGIINLVSKDPAKKPELSLTANQSTLKETNLNGYYSQRFKKIGITLFAGQTFQKQVDVDKDGLSDVPNVNSLVIHPRVMFYFNPNSTLTLNYTGTFDKRAGGEMAYFSDKQNDSLYRVSNTAQRHSGDLKWVRVLSEKNNLTLKISGSQVNQTLSNKQYVFDASQLIYYSELSYVHSVEKTDWVAGVNFNGDNFNNKSASLPVITDYNYNTIGAFVQNTWRPTQKFIMESGLRVDHHSQYGNFALPRLCFMYHFSDAVLARLNGGFGYKTPNVITYVDPETDLNHIQRAGPLDPEVAQGTNADINYHKLIVSRKLDITVNQSFFYTHITRPIFDSSSTNNAVWLVNGDKGLITRGFQTYSRIQYKDWEFFLGYVFTDVQRQFNKAHPMPATTPKHILANTLVYEPEGHWRAGIESSFFAGQLDENYKRVKSYLFLATMVQYNVGHFSIVLNGENMLDFRQSKYERIYDGSIHNPEFHKLWAPIDGRVINLSVKWKM